VLLPVPFILLFSIRTGRALTARYTSLQESITGLYDFLETCFTGIRVIKANAKEASQEKFFSQKTAAQKAAEIATARLGIIFSYFFHYAGFISVVILYAVGGKMVIEGKTGLGELIAFQFYSSMIIHPLMDISQFFIAGNRAGVSIKRVDELLRSKSGVKPPKEPLQTGLFENISYSGVALKAPKGGGEALLKDLTFTVAKGSRAAVVGRIGSGKSTLLSLALRLCDYSEGEIRVNGTDIRELDLKTLRGKIGYVSQEPAIFTGTITDNILMGRKGISAEMTERALEISRLKQDLHRFPKGCETQVGTRGFALSGGQKQRLAIARAVLSSPELLLLDDATSAMDAGTEDEFWKMLKLHLPEAICIAVTHRSRTIETSDLILAMQEGRIAEQGTHKELMAAAGLYKEIYERRKLEEAYKKN
jgi:ABC-type multidrug transport system fused ATPase/permease subunit